MLHFPKAALNVFQKVDAKPVNVYESITKAAVCFQLEYLYHEVNKDRLEQEQLLRSQLQEITKKIDANEEELYVNRRMSRETFDKFYTRFKKEELNICRELGKYTGKISNLKKLIESTIALSFKLTVLWGSSDIKVKEVLQKLLFPEGIVFDRKTGGF